MSNFTIVKVLASIFTPDFSLGNTLRIAGIASDLLGDRLDGAPTMLPLPQGAPSDIPRITLASSDSLLKLSISPARTNLNFGIPPDALAQEIDYSDYYSTFPNFFFQFVTELDLRVQRLGYVTERLERRNDALSYVMERFCNREVASEGGPFNRAKQFELHSLKKYEHEGFNVNSWVRLKCTRIKAGSENLGHALLAINDLNTLSIEDDPGANFGADDISRFFQCMPDHVNQILNVYFEEE